MRVQEVTMCGERWWCWIGCRRQSSTGMLP